jgi:hypothetical protein
MADGSSRDELEASKKKLISSFSRIAKAIDIKLKAGDSGFQQLRKELCDCWEELVGLRQRCEASINDDKFKEMQERYNFLLSRVSDSGEDHTNRGSSASSHNSAASRKRRAELRLRQVRERQEIERKSEELRRELELQTARHEVEQAVLEDEESDGNESREYMSLPDGSSPDDKVRDYVKKCSKDLPYDENSDILCDNVPRVQTSVQDFHGNTETGIN